MIKQPSYLTKLFGTQPAEYRITDDLNYDCYGHNSLNDLDSMSLSKKGFFSNPLATISTKNFSKKSFGGGGGDGGVESCSSEKSNAPAAAATIPSTFSVFNLKESIIKAKNSLNIVVAPPPPPPPPSSASVHLPSSIYNLNYVLTDNDIEKLVRYYKKKKSDKKEKFSYLELFTSKIFLKKFKESYKDEVIYKKYILKVLKEIHEAEAVEAAAAAAAAVKQDVEETKDDENGSVGGGSSKPLIPRLNLEFLNPPPPAPPKKSFSSWIYSQFVRLAENFRI